VVSGSDDGTARVWDMESRKTILGPINTGPILGNAVVYSPDETLIATGASGSSDIEIWDAKTGERVSALKGHTKFVWCLAWTLDGRTLISGSVDYSIRTWDTTTWKQIAVLTEHTNIVSGLAISPNGRILASASFDKTARLWNLENGRPICSPLHHKTSVTSTSFSADGMLLATGCTYSISAYTWDVSAIVREAGLDYLLSDSDVSKKYILCYSVLLTMTPLFRPYRYQSRHSVEPLNELTLPSRSTESQF
jgi:WD40 repeat protein